MEKSEMTTLKNALNDESFTRSEAIHIIRHALAAFYLGELEGLCEVRADHDEIQEILSKYSELFHRNADRKLKKIVKECGLEEEF